MEIVFWTCIALVGVDLFSLLLILRNRRKAEMVRMGNHRPFVDFDTRLEGIKVPNKPF